MASASTETIFPGGKVLRTQAPIGAEGSLADRLFTSSRLSAAETKLFYHFSQQWDPKGEWLSSSDQLIANSMVRWPRDIQGFGATEWYNILQDDAVPKNKCRLFMGQSSKAASSWVLEPYLEPVLYITIRENPILKL